AGNRGRVGEGIRERKRPRHWRDLLGALETQTRLPLEQRRPSWQPRSPVTVACAGCAATATEERRGGGLLLPTGWTARGQTSDGAIALWCGQCSFERRYERESEVSGSARP